jgi:hypothetical protein
LQPEPLMGGSHGNQATGEFPMTPTANDLVLCRSDMGDGGWSLHAPDSTDEAIACGEACYLTSGEAKMQDGKWTRPDPSDYGRALRILAERN